MNGFASLLADAVSPGLDGFLGTRASIMLDVVFVAMFAVLPVMTYSIMVVKRTRFALHKTLQLGWARCCSSPSSRLKSTCGSSPIGNSRRPVPLLSRRRLERSLDQPRDPSGVRRPDPVRLDRRHFARSAPFPRLPSRALIAICTRNWAGSRRSA